MNFDWRAFLESEGIEYVETGPNVAKGHINIQCPFCGPADPSHHMGLRLEDAAWACYRSADHRGRAPTYLVAKLANVSQQVAKQMVRLSKFPQEVDLDNLKERLRSDGVRVLAGHPIEMPSQLHQFRPHTSSKAERRFLDYLAARHVAPGMAVKYGLRWAISGPFKHRVVFPIYDAKPKDTVAAGRKLVGLTGRAIVDAKARYWSFPSLTDYLYLAERAVGGGHTLAITEGPMDALKLAIGGRNQSVRAVALLGLSVTPGKMERLAALAAAYERLVIVLDEAAAPDALKLQSRLSPLGAAVEFAPGEDPGALTVEEAEKFARKLKVEA